MALRMLGLFLVLPVLALYADGLPGSTPLLIGLAVGIYGLTQALLQIPAGALSDRIGRRPVIIVGLLLFAAGSVLAALADTAFWLIVGRALQGSGAISAAVTAWVADGTRDDQRTKAMAILGMSIGFSFMLALVLGPVLAGWIGVDGIFWLTASLALLATVLIAGNRALAAIELPKTASRGWRTAPSEIFNRDLLRLDAGIFFLHAILTATFIAVPFVLRDGLSLAVAEHWQVYLGVMVASLVLLVPAVKLSRQSKWQRGLFILAVAVIVLVSIVLAAAPVAWITVLVLLWLFFGAFNFLEASLPTLVSRQVDPARKGAALGVYSTSQFLGAFVGALMAGWLLEVYGLRAIFIANGVFAALWLLIAVRQRFAAPILASAEEEFGVAG